MRAGHWLAPSGLTKHMALGAVLDAGGDIEAACRAAASVEGSWSLRVEEAQVSSIRCLRASVTADQPDLRGRALRISELTAVIERLDLTDGARALLSEVYRRLFATEAHVHGTPFDETRLHESGTTINLAILASTCAGLASLNLNQVTIGQIAVGSGWIESASHGVLPIPPPAVAHLLTGYWLSSGPIAGERVSPTSAAFIQASAAPDQMPPMTLEKTGRGADSSDGPSGFASLLIGRLPHEEAATT